MKARSRTKKPDSYKVATLELDRPRLAAGWVEEPALIFADDHEHVDPKTGIPLYGPRSLGTRRHKREVHVGFIGTSGSVDLARRYYEQASYGVDGDDDHAPFPGCRADQGFRCDLLFDNKLVELLTRSEHQDILGIKRSRERFEKLLLMLELKLRLLMQRDHPLDYIVLALPTDLYQRCRAVDYVEKGFGHIHRDLRRAFKAMAMQYQKPTQILLESTSRLTDSNRDLDHCNRDWTLRTGSRHGSWLCGGQSVERERGAGALSDFSGTFVGFLHTTGIYVATATSPQAFAGEGFLGCQETGFAHSRPLR